MSDKQKAILDFIREFIASHRYPPSMREIGSGTGIKSTSYIAYQLNALEKLGYIQRDYCISRSIRLTEPSEQAE